MEKGIIATKDRQASQAEIVKWVDATRDLAMRWPFGEARAADLRAVAEAVESTFTIQRCFVRSKWPTTPARQHQLQTSLSFWAIRELRAAVVALCPDRAIPTMAAYAREALVVGPGLQRAARRDLIDKAFAEASLEKRVRAFERRIRPDAKTDLMAWALHDTVSCGEDDAGRVEISMSPADFSSTPTQKPL
jgi:hypothetical protein